MAEELAVPEWIVIALLVSFVALAVVLDEKEVQGGFAGTRQLEHASNLKVDLSGGELPGRKVDPRR